MDFEQRRYIEQMTDQQVAAACLVDLMGWLIYVSEDHVSRGEETPAWISHCSGLLNCAFTHLVPEMPWEQLVLMAADASRQLPLKYDV